MNAVTQDVPLPSARSETSAPPTPADVTAARRLPSVDRVLQWPAVRALIEEHGRRFVTKEVRTQLQSWRAARLQEPKPPAPHAPFDEPAIVAALAAGIRARLQPKLRRVHNLTGTVLHTNLGRAPLAEEAIAAVASAMRGPVNLEFDLDSGGRGDRDSLVESLLCELTGAEAATVVNNNAAAVLLTIAALGARREVLISRGELVEIGGSFRMPDVMASAGARMIEVGTTNRTHARDFQNAITRKTALVLKVHASNYVVQGFTAAVPEAELAALARAAGVPFAVDLGSGSLIDLAPYGLPREPLPQESLKAGADVVTFSGDKLLGGPQAGIILGRENVIARIKKHPLKRALRASKLVLAALEATLALYRHPEQLAERLPSLRLLTRPRAQLQQMAERLAGPLSAALAEGMPHAQYAVSVAAVSSQIGSGSLPVDLLPSAALVVRTLRTGRGSSQPITSLATALRSLPVPVLGRVTEGALVLDLRTLEDEDGFRRQLALLRAAPPPAQAA